MVLCLGLVDWRPHLLPRRGCERHEERPLAHRAAEAEGEVDVGARREDELGGVRGRGGVGKGLWDGSG